MHGRDLKGISRCQRRVSEVRKLQHGVEDRNDEMVCFSQIHYFLSDLKCDPAIKRHTRTLAISYCLQIIFRFPDRLRRSFEIMWIRNHFCFADESVSTQGGRVWGCSILSEGNPARLAASPPLPRSFFELELFEELISDPTEAKKFQRFEPYGPRLTRIFFFGGQQLIVPSVHPSWRTDGSWGERIRYKGYFLSHFYDLSPSFTLSPFKFDPRSRDLLFTVIKYGLCISKRPLSTW